MSAALMVDVRETPIGFWFLSDTPVRVPSPGNQPRGFHAHPNAALRSASREDDPVPVGDRLTDGSFRSAWSSALGGCSVAHGLVLINREGDAVEPCVHGDDSADLGDAGVPASFLDPSPRFGCW